jgi:hypothetical protein
MPAGYGKVCRKTTGQEARVGRKGRGDHERHGGGPGRGRERPEGGRQDGEVGYKDRVHERLDRMDQRLETLEMRLERHLKGGDA